jgi:excinuclease ABC subunit C
VSDGTDTIDERLRAQADRLPGSAGVYAFLDAEGKTLYVGKASDLRTRVRSYLAGRDTRPLVRLILRRAIGVEVIATKSAAEALLLENTRIKQEQPPYNLRLKDDKSYLVVRIDKRHPFPRLRLQRRIQKDGATYFGPFASAKAVRRTVAFLRTLYPLRSCSDRELLERERPCLYHQIGRCAAPCVGKIDSGAYGEHVEGTLAVLRGRDEGLTDRLRSGMEVAAEALEFERAALLRDRLEALEASVSRSVSVSPDFTDRDVVAVASGEGVSIVAVHFVRDGHLVATRSYPQKTSLPRRDVVTAFLAQFHAQGKIVPPEILVEEEPVDRPGVEDVLSALRGGPVKVRVPQRGPLKEILDAAAENARLSLAEHAATARDAAAGLVALGERLGLAAPPTRIEGYDLSHTAGTEPVGAMSVLIDGVPDPSSYRHFAVREAPGGDDYAGMREVVRRRFAKGAELGALPDLVLIDGGPNQVAVALEAIRGLGLEPPALVGLAKARSFGGVSTRERVVLPGREEPLPLDDDDPALRILVRVRDEAHRFAGRYQKKRRSVALTGTALDGIPGLGPKRRQTLLTRFGSVEGIRTAPFEDLAAVPGVGERLARTIRERLGTEGAGL